MVKFSHHRYAQISTEKEMEKIKILGTNITAAESYESVFHKLKSSLNTPGYITVNNVHTIIEATKNPVYKKILNQSLLALPDGKPLSVYAKLKGEKNITRIFGPTFMEKTLEFGQKDGLKHFFFGSSVETIEKLKEQIILKFPLAKVEGYYSPLYKKEFSAEENDKFISLMNESDADLFWIGLGAPKQEIWMYENYKNLNRGIMIGIGAGFDYLAGKTKHAPEWMKNASLEWLYRLIQEPRRLWKRYLVTNSLFLWYVLLEFLHLKKFDN